jgi:hypothetical protein
MGGAKGVNGRTQELQDKFNANFPEFSTYSGLRNSGYNASVGGASGSQHIHGNAFDFKVPADATDERKAEAYNFLRDNGGQGFGYYNNNSGHVDMRDGDAAAWGPNRSRSSIGQTPEWYQGFANNHLKGGPKGAGAKGNDKKDGKDGDQKDREDPTDKNKAKGKEKNPPEAQKHDDIKGKRNAYEKTQTKSIVGRLPTHEPWPYHPKSQVGPRGGINRADPGNNKGTDSVSNPNGGTSGSGDSSGGSNGSSGSNSSSGGQNTPGGATNIDKSSDPEKAKAIEREAKRLGINGEDLATIISYESAGSMDPSKRGGMNKDGSGRGSFLGLIQFSPDNQRKYGVTANQSFSDQMKSVGDYLIDRGVKPGMSQLQVYSAINAGRAARDDNDPILNRSDVNGNQRQHIQKMNASGHRSRAKKIMGSAGAQIERADKGMNKDAKSQSPTAPASSNASPTSASSATGQDSGSSQTGGSSLATNTGGNADSAGKTTGTGQGDAPKVKVSLVGSQT